MNHSTAQFLLAAKQAEIKALQQLSANLFAGDQHQ